MFYTSKISNAEVEIMIFFPLCSWRDTYVKAMPGESPNDRNDRGLFFPWMANTAFKNTAP